MSKAVSRLALAASVLLAMVFTFSCSSDDEGGGGSSPSQPSSSSNAHIGKGNNISNYRTVVIGTQTWMAENLDYVVEGSKCYSDNPARCNTYGSLYDWATAMGFDERCNSSSCSSQIQSPHRGICPDGWHIPSDEEWTTLTDFVGSDAGTKLKSATGWTSGNGTDDYEFSALPGGHAYFRTNSDGVGSAGYWWSAGESSGAYAYYRIIGSSSEVTRTSNNFKSYSYSVRCVKD